MFSNKIIIRTINEFYDLSPPVDIALIDELDEIIMEYPYHIENLDIKGLWNLQDLELVGFTATFDSARERVS